MLIEVASCGYFISIFSFHKILLLAHLSSFLSCRRFVFLILLFLRVAGTGLMPLLYSGCVSALVRCVNPRKDQNHKAKVDRK